MNPENKRNRIKKMIGETVTLTTINEGGTEHDLSPGTIIDVGEKCVWLGQPGEHPVPINLSEIKKFTVDLEEF